MNTILALAALGPWSYAGFLEQPAPKPGPARPAPVVPGPTVPPPVVEVEARQAPALPLPSPPPAPARHRMADALGQLWEHPDAESLRAFVEARNRSIANVTPSTMPAGPRCAGGRCR